VPFVEEELDDKLKNTFLTAGEMAYVSNMVLTFIKIYSRVKLIFPASLLLDDII